MRCALFYRTEKLAVEGETPVSLRFAQKSPLSLGLLGMGLALGVPLLRDGVGFLIFHKVSFEKHSTDHIHVQMKMSPRYQ